MKKAELIKHLAGQTGQTQRTVAELFSALELTLQNNAAAGEPTYLGLLTVTVAAKAERQGRNPKTGEPKTIPAHNAIKVKVSKMLKDAANGAAK